MRTCSLRLLRFIIEVKDCKVAPVAKHYRKFFACGAFSYYSQQGLESAGFELRQKTVFFRYSLGDITVANDCFMELRKSDVCLEEFCWLKIINGSIDNVVLSLNIKEYIW